MAELVFKTSLGFTNGYNSAKIAAIQPSASETSDLAFYTYGSGTGSEQVRITSGGAVGIGTTSPTNYGAGIINLSVNGSAGSAVDVAYNGTRTGAMLAASSLFKFDTAGSTIPMTFSIDGSEAVRIDSSRRLLVGTSSARANFINDTASPKLQIEGEVGISAVRTDATAYPSWLILGKTRSTGNTIVQSDDIIGRIAFEGNDGSEFVDAAFISAEVDGTPGANDMPGRLVFSTTADGAASPTERFRIANNGIIYQYSNQYNFDSSLSTIEIVNRNTAGAKTFQWYVGAGGAAPVATLTTAGVWTNASDVKNKENIEDIAYGIETIKSLRPRQFDVKSDGSHNIGFIAQEVKPLIPEVVHESIVSETGESHLGLDYGSLTAVLTKALQEALLKIESLETRLSALEGA
jgi:hypothetical protein